MTVAIQQPARPRVTNVQDAEALIITALDALDRLAPLVEAETQELKTGKIRKAMAIAEEKNAAAQAYMAAIALLKSNAIAIGRFAPQAIELLKRKHADFSERLALNAAVLTTARTVSEQIIREVTTEASGAHNPQGYGRSGIATSAFQARVSPIAVSKTL